MQQAHAALDLEHRSGGRFEKPEKQFVLLEEWDVAEYGPAENVVEEMVFGKLS